MFCIVMRVLWTVAAFGAGAGAVAVVVDAAGRRACTTTGAAALASGATAAARAAPRPSNQSTIRCAHLSRASSARRSPSSPDRGAAAAAAAAAAPSSSPSSSSSSSSRSGGISGPASTLGTSSIRVSSASPASISISSAATAAAPTSAGDQVRRLLARDGSGQRRKLLDELHDAHAADAFQAMCRHPAVHIEPLDLAESARARAGTARIHALVAAGKLPTEVGRRCVHLHAPTSTLVRAAQSAAKAVGPSYVPMAAAAAAAEIAPVALEANFITALRTLAPHVGVHPRLVVPRRFFDNGFVGHADAFLDPTPSVAKAVADALREANPQVAPARIAVVVALLVFAYHTRGVLDGLLRAGGPLAAGSALRVLPPTPEAKTLAAACEDGVMTS